MWSFEWWIEYYFAYTYTYGGVYYFQYFSRVTCVETWLEEVQSNEQHIQKFLKVLKWNQEEVEKFFQADERIYTFIQCFENKNLSIYKLDFFSRELFDCFKLCQF